MAFFAVNNVTFGGMIIMPVDSLSLVVSASFAIFAPVFLFATLLGAVVANVFRWFKGDT